MSLKLLKIQPGPHKILYIVHRTLILLGECRDVQLCISKSDSSLVTLLDVNSTHQLISLV